MIPLGAQTVIVVHNALDDYGGRSEIGRDTYPGCSIQPMSTSAAAERLDTGDQVITRSVLIGPPNMTASPIDQLIEGAMTYELDGDLQLYRDVLDGQPHHVEAFLRRVSG